MAVDPNDPNNLFRSALDRARTRFASGRTDQQPPMNPQAAPPGTLPATGRPGTLPAPGQGLSRGPQFAISIGGHQPPVHEWQYEAQPDRSWRMYPPGVPAPALAHQASMGNPATPEDLAAIAEHLASLPGRRVGQYRRAGLEPPPPGYHPPGWTGDEDEEGGGGTGGTGGTGTPPPSENVLEPGAAPFVPGVPTMPNPHRNQT